MNTGISGKVVTLAVVLWIWCSTAGAAQRGYGGKVAAPDGSAIGTQWLFLIGIDKYQNWRAWPELDCAVSDAQAVRDVLKASYHIDRVVELYNEAATRSAIYGKLRWLGENTREDDSLLIYYAGHGQLDDFEGIGFWVPVDGAREPTSWLGSDRIKRAVANMKAKHVLLISDSCFAGDFFHERKGIPEITEDYYRRAHALPSRQAMTSGGVEPVADAACKGMSPFAHWLVYFLRQNKKPYLVPTTLFDQLKEGVARGSRQTPRVGYLHGAQDAGGEFIFFLEQQAPSPGGSRPDMSKWQQEQAELARLKAEADRQKTLASAKQALAIAKQYDAASYVGPDRKEGKWSDYLRDFAGTGHEVAYARERLAYWRARGAQGRSSADPLTTEGSHTNVKDGSEMVYIPAGPFRMGDDSGPKYERPAHDVHVGALYIGKCEVTNQQWQAFVDAKPEWTKGRVNSAYHNGEYLRHWHGNSCPADKADHPVAFVSWFAAKAYCEWAGGRLPTEAEWESACRAGSETKYCFGNDESRLGGHAWYDGNSEGSVHPVGQKGPNALGIHDMHGNVWEWTSTMWDTYPYRANDGREDPDDARSGRVCRGGGWFTKGQGCDSAQRAGLSPTTCNDCRGLRLCIPADETAGHMGQLNSDTDPKRAESHWRMAEMLLKAGKRDAAVERLKALATGYPNTPAAERAKARLGDLGQ